MKGRQSILTAAVAASLVATTALGAVAQDEAMESAAVTASASRPEESAGGSRAFIDGAIRGERQIWSAIWEASDPRLSGDLTMVVNTDEYERAEMAVAAASATLQNDDGHWVGSGTSLQGERLGETWTLVLQGQEGYEGLTALVVMGPGGLSVSAAVFPGSMPAIPDGPSAE